MRLVSTPCLISQGKGHFGRFEALYKLCKCACCLVSLAQPSLVQVQEADQCTEVWSEPDPQQAFHVVVVPHHQPCQRVCGFPSAAGSDWHLHARQDPHPQDLPDPDLQGSPVAEGARECGHGLVSLYTASTPLCAQSIAGWRTACVHATAHAVYTQIFPMLRVLATTRLFNPAASHQNDASHSNHLQISVIVSHLLVQKSTSARSC